MGFVSQEEGQPWQPWLDELAAAGRVVREGDRWFAAEASRDPKAVLRGRLEALGPIESEDPLLAELEAEGTVLRTRINGRQAWCNRRLLARIHRYTLERLRKEIEPVTASDLLRFFACWQHVDPGYKLEGPRGVAEAISQLSGFEVAAAAWEGERSSGARARLQARVAGSAHDLGRSRLGPPLGQPASPRSAARPFASCGARSWTTGCRLLRRRPRKSPPERRSRSRRPWPRRARCSCRSSRAP